MTDQEMMEALAELQRDRRDFATELVRLRTALEQVATHYTLHELNYRGRVLSLIASKAIEKDGSEKLVKRAMWVSDTEEGS